MQDELARTIHEDYVRRERAKPVDAPDKKSAADRSLRSWSKLDEDLREQNRSQASDIRGKLEAIGCALAPATDEPRPPFELSDHEMETLARLEHERWMRVKAEQGWTWGARRDDAAKRSPHMKPWAALDESTRDKDRDAIRLIPSLVEMAGCRICRPPAVP